MKFRQFEFRLFPKIKSKKKKKPKLGHADFPRDISLDKNSNISHSRFPPFYDNLAVDTGYTERFPVDIFYRQKCDSMNFISCHNAFYSCSDFKKSSLQELEINISGSTCSCDQCACATDTLPSMTRSCTLGGFNCGSPSGTPTSTQKSRTRIKTNPWVPSPRATPCPSSPAVSEHQEVIQWTKGDNCSAIPVLRPNDLQVTVYYSVPDKSRKSGLMMVKDTGFTDEEQRGVGNISLKSNELNHDDIDADITQFDNIHDKTTTSPLVEFLSCVKYEINFDYENNAEYLLESSSIPSYDSLNIGQSDDNVFVQTEENKNDEVPEITVVSDKFVASDSEYNDVTFDDVTFGDTSNNMQESIDTGYASVSRDSDCLSSDEAGDEMSDLEVEGQTRENRTRSTSDVNSCKEIYPYSNTTGNDVYVDRYDVISDVEQTCDLEWDNEPTAETLLIDIPRSNKIQTVSVVDENLEKDTLQMSTNDLKSHIYQIREYSSVKYRKPRVHVTGVNCLYKRRRSRSLADIEISLEDKVTMLHEEKSFVQLKVREAILEDKIRDHQLKVIRLLSGEQRKQLIIKTLYNLKTRLEDQSARLQASYSTVISLKNMFSQRRTLHDKTFVDS